MRRVHLIGIGGTGMATLAIMLKAKGLQVGGSDQAIYPPMSELLAHAGIVPLEGYRAEHITSEIDFVVIGNAVSRGNPELEAVLDQRIRYGSMPEVIRDWFLWGARSVVVAGTHGKTTTAAMTGWLLTHAGLDPSVLVGGVVENFASSCRLGGGRDFVIEGDEYDSAFFDKTAKFLKYLPDLVIVNNVEFDHADIYPDLDALRLAFRRLVHLVPRRGLALLGADDPGAMALAAHAPCAVESFGFSAEADWQAHDVEAAPTWTRFGVRRRGAPFGTAVLPMLGRHNVRNALAAVAVGAHLGVDGATLLDGLGSFRGVRRRLQICGTVGDVTVFDDFAHHPTAVAETLQAVRSAAPTSRVWAVFEPRSATACRRVFQQAFAEALAGADEVVLARVFRSSIPPEDRLSVETLVAELGRRGTRARSIPEVGAIVSTIAREARPGDLVVIMSNGAFDDIHRRLLEALAAGER